MKVRRIGKDKNELYKEELLRIGKIKPLTPFNIVSEATDKTSVLHDWFEWDDAVASDKWRIRQARELVNVIIETPEMSDDSVTHSFEIIKTNGSSEYKHVYEIFDNKEWKQQVIEQAVTYLRIWRRKYNIYSEFKEVSKAIDTITTTFERKKHGTKTRKHRTISVSS